MEITRAYKFSVYPDAKRRSEIDERLLLAQRLYNKFLEQTIDAHKKDGSSKVSVSQLNLFLKVIIADNNSFLQLYSQTRQDIFIRVIKAYQNFFRRAKARKSGAKVKAGFPRFKSRERYKSITYPQDNGSFHIEKNGKKMMLRVSKIGRMRIELHRKIEGKIKTMTIKKEGRKYYAIFTAIQEITHPIVKDTNPIGIDLGLNNFVALSNGETFQKPKFVNQRRKRIAIWQKRVSRRVKGSKRRQFAKEKLQKEWAETTNQSEDFAHKLSDKLVDSGYTSFAVEKLGIQNMVKNHRLAQSIYNASWNRFIQLLSYKAESAGMKVIEVDARNTSKECSRCDNIQDMPLSERIYLCNKCGLQMDRDVNASINILKRTTLGQRGSHAQGENVRPQHEAVPEELRTDKIHPLQDAVIA